MQTWYTKFGVSAIICFRVMLITDTHTTAIKRDFRIQMIPKHVNQSNPQFRKFGKKQYFHYQVWLRKSKNRITLNKILFHSGAYIKYQYDILRTCIHIYITRKAELHPEKCFVESTKISIDPYLNEKLC